MTIKSKAQYEFVLRVAKGEEESPSLSKVDALKALGSVTYGELPDRVGGSQPPKIREAKSVKVI